MLKTIYVVQDNGVNENWSDLYTFFNYESAKEFKPESNGYRIIKRVIEETVMEN